MSATTPVASPTDSVLDPIRELVDSYGRAHDVDVWFWQRIAGEWTLVAGTSSPPFPEPGTAAVPVNGPRGGESRVEVSADDPEKARGSATFLSLVLGRILQHENESRFFGREIAERYEEITLLYTISEILGSVISLEQAAQRILREVVDTMSVKRAQLWVYEPSINSLRLVASVGGDGQGETIPVDDYSSVTAAVFRDRRFAILEEGDQFPREENVPEIVRRESFLSVPVSYTPPHEEPRTIGVINLIGRRVPEEFTAGDHKLISAIASQIGAAVENSRLVEESVRQQRMDREMELAHDLQLKLLPSASHFDDRADVAARCEPAESVGGDFYHLIGLPNGCFGVVIGDVSSHGFGAALIMALTMSAVAIHASEGHPPAEVLCRAHRALIDELESTEMYLSLFYGVIDPAGRTLTYANAGHPHAYVVSRSGQVRRLPVTNPPFGIVDLDDYAQQTVEWASREDLLFLFTDGLSDSLGRRGERRLVEHVVTGRDRPLDELLDSLFELGPQDNSIPSDDRTAVLVRV